MGDAKWEIEASSINSVSKDILTEVRRELSSLIKDNPSKSRKFEDFIEDEEHRMLELIESQLLSNNKDDMPNEYYCPNHTEHHG